MALTSTRASQMPVRARVYRPHRETSRKFTMSYASAWHAMRDALCDMALKSGSQMSLHEALQRTHCIVSYLETDGLVTRVSLGELSPLDAVHNITWGRWGFMILGY